MEFQKDQKVVALCDIFITDPIGLPVTQLLRKDDVYVVKDTDDLCCLQAVDVGFRLQIKDGNLLLHCSKCRNRFEIKYEETIWLWSTWFRPLDNYAKELLRKLFGKKPNHRPIKIRHYPHRIEVPRTEPDELTEHAPHRQKPLMVPGRTQEPESV